MSAQVEKSHFPRAVRIIGEALPVVIAVLLFIYYCVHPDMYSADGDKTLLRSNRTYALAVITLAMIAFWLVPVNLSKKLNRILSWVWFALAPFAVYFTLLYMDATRFKIKFFELNKVALVLTFVFLFLVQSLLFCLTGSIRFSVIIYAILIAAIGIINCFVVSFRGRAISAADLFSLGTGLSVASEYTYTLTWYMFMEIVLTFGICLMSLKLRGGRMMPPAARGLFLALVAVVAGGYYYLCGETSFLEDHDIRSKGYTHQLRYKQYDMIFTTLTTCFYLVVDKPEGYSAQAAEDIGAEYVEKAKEDNEALAADGGAQTPNIVVIMNESWADYTDIGNTLVTTEDYMPFIHNLTENTIKGTAYASVFGSNTPNSEYEFLTGNTMAFLPVSSVGFNLFVRGAMPSLASELDEEGYYTLAIHPYRGSNYRRDTVYPQIGFDTYYSISDFETAYFIRKYISDKTLFKRVIQEYEDHVESSDQPILSYNVTIQNHGGYYTYNQKHLSDDIKVLNDGIDVDTAQMYVNLVKATDDAFEYLIEYFETREEPVVVIMFGDHQPDLGEDTYSYLLGSEDSRTPEEEMEMYKIPFIVWANYDIEEETIEKTSLNYLYSIIADRLGMEKTGYQEYLLDLSETIPAINVVGYWDADDNFYEIDDKDSPYYELVNEYNILEYNYIFGGDNRDLDLFTLDGWAGNE